MCLTITRLTDRRSIFFDIFFYKTQPDTTILVWLEGMEIEKFSLVFYLALPILKRQSPFVYLFRLEIIFAAQKGFKRNKFFF